MERNPNCAGGELFLMKDMNPKMNGYSQEAFERFVNVRLRTCSFVFIKLFHVEVSAPAFELAQ